MNFTREMVEGLPITVDQLYALVQEALAKYFGCADEDVWWDLVQDCVLDILKSAKTYDAKRGNITTWVFLRVRKVLSDKKIANSRLKRSVILLSEQDLVQETEEDDNLSVWDLLEDPKAEREMKERVEWRSLLEAFEKMGMEYRLVAERIGDGYSLQEIANELGTTPNRVSSIVKFIARKVGELDGATLHFRRYRARRAAKISCSRRQKVEPNRRRSGDMVEATSQRTLRR